MVAPKRTPALKFSDTVSTSESSTTTSTLTAGWATRNFVTSGNRTNCVDGREALILRVPGAMRTVAAGVNHQQPGDPQKLAEVLVSFVDTPKPPVRLPLGSDTVAVIETKNAQTAMILKAWRATAVSTDFAS
jgi:hypothetical protein